MEVPPNEDMAEATLTECAICYEPFGTDSKWRAPKTLLCRHCLCLSCLKKMVCRNAVTSFIICPFCRMLTVLPEEGVHALKTDEETLRTLSKATHLEQTERESVANSAHSPGAESLWDYSTSNSILSLDTEPSFSNRSSIFTVSDMVSPYGNGFHRAPAIWGGRYLQELQSAYIGGVPQRLALPGSQPPQSYSVENIRVCFALCLIVFIVSIFFMLVFLK